MSDPEAAIAALDDTRALETLRLVLDRLGILPAADLRATQDHLQQALPRLSHTSAIPPDLAATPGDLARTCLSHIAATIPGGTDLITRAAAITTPPGQRADPITLTVGALILLAVRTELHLQHKPGTGWTIDLRTKPLSDTTIGKILAQLIGTYLKP